jgi:hypothetical protein
MPRFATANYVSFKYSDIIFSTEAGSPRSFDLDFFDFVSCHLSRWPEERKPWSRKAAGRKQRKFAKREAAESFLEEAKREWIRTGGVNLATDSAAHYDFMRAMEVIADIPNGTLEKAAEVYRLCRSARERV